MNNLPGFASVLDKYLRVTFEYTAPLVHVGLCATLNVCRKKVRLYLRCNPSRPWPSQTLVVASLAFHDTRREHGRRLFHFLAGLGEQHGYAYLGIECPNPDGQKFANALGFREMEYQAWFMSTGELLGTEYRERPRDNGKSPCSNPIATAGFGALAACRPRKLHR